MQRFPSNFLNQYVDFDNHCLTTPLGFDLLEKLTNIQNLESYILPDHINQENADALLQKIRAEILICHPDKNGHQPQNIKSQRQDVQSLLILLRQKIQKIQTDKSKSRDASFDPSNFEFDNEELKGEYIYRVCNIQKKFDLSKEATNLLCLFINQHGIGIFKKYSEVSNNNSALSFEHIVFTCFLIAYYKNRNDLGHNIEKADEKLKITSDNSQPTLATNEHSNSQSLVIKNPNIDLKNTINWNGINILDHLKPQALYDMIRWKFFLANNSCYEVQMNFITQIEKLSTKNHLSAKENILYWRATHVFKNHVFF